MHESGFVGNITKTGFLLRYRFVGHYNILPTFPNNKNLMQNSAKQPQKPKKDTGSTARPLPFSKLNALDKALRESTIRPKAGKTTRGDRAAMTSTAPA